MIGGPYFLASVALFVVLFLAYVVVSLSKRREYRVDAGELATLAGAAFAAPAGFRVLAIALTNEDLGALSGLADRAYILIGGVVVATGSVVAVGRIFVAVWRAGTERAQKEAASQSVGEAVEAVDDLAAQERERKDAD